MQSSVANVIEIVLLTINRIFKKGKKKDPWKNYMYEFVNAMWHSRSMQNIGTSLKCDNP